MEWRICAEFKIQFLGGGDREQDHSLPCAVSEAQEGVRGLSERGLRAIAEEDEGDEGMVGAAQGEVLGIFLSERLLRVSPLPHLLLHGEGVLPLEIIRSSEGED